MLNGWTSSQGLVGRSWFACKASIPFERSSGAASSEGCKERRAQALLFFCHGIVTMVWKASVLQACEAISFSAAKILVIKKGPLGPSFLIINGLSIQNINAPFIEFFPFLHRQALSFAPTLCHRGWAQWRIRRSHSLGRCVGHKPMHFEFQLVRSNSLCR